MIENEREELIERLIRAMCATIRQWDDDSLYEFVAEIGNYRKLSDEELLEQAEH